MNKSVSEKLQAVQIELKAPKGQYNSFGKYHYRSCEDILEAVKPLLQKHRLLLCLGDSLEEIGGRVYVRATATVTDIDSIESESYVSVSAYAREDESKNGMDGSQITGSSSSYARKYALNGLFLIDDCKDADAIGGGKPADPLATIEEIGILKDLCTALNCPYEKTMEWYKGKGMVGENGLTRSQCQHIMKAVTARAIKEQGHETTQKPNH